MKKMNKINVLICVVLMAIISSCNSQNRIDLETVVNKNVDEVVGEIHYEFLEREIVTHQPAYQIWGGIEKFRFGNINLVADEGIFEEESYVIFILDSAENKKIVGLFVGVENNEEQAKKMMEYITSRYGEPEIIQPESAVQMKDGLLLGNSAYYWPDKQNNCSLYFYRLYSGRVIDQKMTQVIGYNVQIIQNDAILSENTEWKIIDWYKTRFRKNQHN